MATQPEKAEIFRELHHRKGLLVLPNAWDIPSARIFEDAGFPAIATSSAALDVSVGYPDGERIPKPELFAIVRRIAHVLSVPLSVDIESGFGESMEELADTIRRVVEAGGIGVNVEDASHPHGRGLRATKDQAERIRTIREVSDSLGVPLVINARTDAFNLVQGDAKEKITEAILRSKAYEAAGADCLYPMGLVDRDAIRSFAEAVHTPMNVMVRRGTPPVPELERLGVKRLSLGPSPMYAAMGLLRRAAGELKEKGTYEALTSGAITYEELNALAEPKRP